MRRLIEDRILYWKEHSSGKALLVTGARQVGKTYTVREFGRRHYGSFIELDFLKDARARGLFESSKTSEEILLRLSALEGNRMIKGDTLIFLDEVQECPEAVTAIKFLVEEGSYDYILSGSMLGVETKNIKSLPVGYMDVLDMYPMNFEEFCLALGVTDEVISALRRSFRDLAPVDDFLHERFMSLFELYLIVGGMPAAVKKYLETNNLQCVLEEQRAISRLCRQDIAKQDPRDKLYMDRIYDLIPSELNSRNKRFMAGDLKEGMKFARVEGGILRLAGAGVALEVRRAAEPRVPLLLSGSRNLMKLFLCDVGLLASMYMNDIQLKILNREKNMNSGAVFENAVAQELKCGGFDLYYYRSKRFGELDFLIEQDGEVVPVEVKSGKDYTVHSALDNVLASKEYDIKKTYILSGGNVRRDGRKIYLPVYMAMFIRRKEMPDMIYKPDIPGAGPA